MGSKKTTTAPSLQTLKIGSRIRRTDDHAEGRIVWANGVSVKITWDDGQQVTWRRDSLADRPITILVGGDDQPATTREAKAEGTASAILEETAPSPAPAELKPAQDGSQATSEPTPKAGKRKRRRKAAAEPQQKKLSALDAAAQVLAETGAPMSCKEMIGAMAGKGYWTSPGGKTPDATLCSAVLREIKVKGEQSRFLKVGPGRFGRRSA